MLLLQMPVKLNGTVPSLMRLHLPTTRVSPFRILDAPDFVGMICKRV